MHQEPEPISSSRIHTKYVLLCFWFDKAIGDGGSGDFGDCDGKTDADN